jgi:hypothetical protein
MNRSTWFAKIFADYDDYLNGEPTEYLEVGVEESEGVVTNILIKAEGVTVTYSQQDDAGTMVPVVDRFIPSHWYYTVSAVIMTPAAHKMLDISPLDLFSRKES